MLWVALCMGLAVPTVSAQSFTDLDPNAPIRQGAQI